MKQKTRAKETEPRPMSPTVLPREAQVDEVKDLITKGKEAGFLTRDPRIHERKKYGQKGARKRFQFSKR